MDLAEFGTTINQPDHEDPFEEIGEGINRLERGEVAGRLVASANRPASSTARRSPLLIDRAEDS